MTPIRIIMLMLRTSAVESAVVRLIRSDVQANRGGVLFVPTSSTNKD
jgi:hypothetical protein